MKQKNALIIAGSIIIASIIIVAGIKLNKSPQEICFEERVKFHLKTYKKPSAILFATQDCKS